MPLFFFLLSQDMAESSGAGRGGIGHPVAHHDQGILARVLVVAAAQRHGAEAEAAIELLRREVRGAHLERDALLAAGFRLGDEPLEEIAADPAALEGRRDREVSEMHLAVETPGQEIPGENTTLAHDDRQRA